MNRCDVCGGIDPPRNPLWRSNTDKVCDPCQSLLEEKLAARVNEAVMQGVGFIAQVLNPDGVWLSWTQFTTQLGRSQDDARSLATATVRRLLENPNYDFQSGRVVRADWVVVESIAKNAVLEEGG